MSSVFSRRSYATLLVPLIRLRGRTDMPYACKTQEQMQKNKMMMKKKCFFLNKMLHVQRNHRISCLLQTRCQQTHRDTDTLFHYFHYVGGLRGRTISRKGEMIKMVESIIVKRFIGETCCNHFVWMLPFHAALVQFTAEQCPHVTRLPSGLDMSNFLTGFCFVF